MEDRFFSALLVLLAFYVAYRYYSAAQAKKSKSKAAAKNGAAAHNASVYSDEKINEIIRSDKYRVKGQFDQ